MAGKRYHHLNEHEADQARGMDEVEECQFCNATEGL